MLDVKSKDKKKELRNEQMKLANRDYRKKLRESGYHYFCVWIPKSILEKVKKYIEGLKKNE